MLGGLCVMVGDVGWLVGARERSRSWHCPIDIGSADEADGEADGDAH